jgi:Flp pilus assembly protein TadD
LGELHLQAGRYENAETHFRAEAKLSPGSAATAYKLGLTLANLGRSEEARIELERADRLRPGMPETMFQLGKLYTAVGNSRKAEEYFLKVLAAEQHTELAESAHFQLAQVYRKLGRTTDAERQTEMFRRLRSRRANPSIE